MERETLTVSINEHDSVTALLYTAPKKTRVATTVILGHGAGANQLSPFMRLFAEGLAERGFDTMTFNFLYMEKGKRVPDPREKLEACYSAVIQTAKQHRMLKDNRIVVGGKSMGGRIASQVAATESGADIAALVLLGYPLHPPGKPEQLRDKHLKDIRAPVLFVQGSRDAFGTSEEIRAVIKNHHLPATLYEIEGGDHSFKVPKNVGIPQNQIHQDVMDEIRRWLSNVTSGSSQEKY